MSDPGHFSICRIFLLALLVQYASATQTQEAIIYKDQEGHRCVLLQPNGKQSMGKNFLKNFKHIDDLTFEEIDVLDVQELDDEEVEDEWGNEASVWCENLRKYSVLVEKRPEKNDDEESHSRSKRDTSSYYRRQRNDRGTYYRRPLRRNSYHRQSQYQSPPNSYYQDGHNDRRRYPNYYYSSPAYTDQRYRGYRPSAKSTEYNPERYELSRNMMQSDDANANSNVFSNNSPVKIDEKGGLNTYSHVQVLKEGSKAEASSNGGIDGRNSDAQVSGSYSAAGTFSAQAKSGFPKGQTKVQVQGTKDGSSAESTADIDQLGRALSMTRLAPKGVAAANAEGSFNDGSTYVQSEGNREGGKSSARANSPGQTSSHAQVLMDGSTDEENSEDYVGMSSARSGGDIAGGHAQSQVSGAYNTKNKYVALASGGFGDHSATDASSDSTGNEGLPTLPAASTRRRPGQNGNGYQVLPGEGNNGRGYVSPGSSISRPNYDRVQPSGLGPQSVRKLPSGSRYNGRGFSSRTGPLNGNGKNGAGFSDRTGSINGNGRYDQTGKNGGDSFQTGSNGNNGYGSNGSNGSKYGRNGYGSNGSKYGNNGHGSNGNSNVGAFRSSESNKPKSNQKPCCNVQYICCVACCKDNGKDQQSDSPRFPYRQTSGRRYGNFRRSRTSDDSKKRISTLIKMTEELQNDQPETIAAQRPNRYRPLRRPSATKAYRSPAKSVHHHNYQSNKVQPTTSPYRSYYKPAPKRSTLRLRIPSRSHYRQQDSVKSLYSDANSYLRRRMSNGSQLKGLYNRNARLNSNRYKDTSSTPSNTRKNKLSVRSNRRGNSASSGNDFNNFSRYRNGSGRSRNSRGGSKPSNPCAVQFKCSYKLKSFGRVRHCKPFKPAGCS